MNILKIVWIMAFIICMSISALGQKEIILQPQRLPQKRSIDLALPIRAFIEESSKELSLEFTEGLGELCVIVSDCRGNIVYSNFVQILSTQSVVISLSSLIEGEYNLSIIKNENELTGNFIINN